MNADVLFDADPEMAALDLSALRALVSDDRQGVTRKGRALLELGRRTSSRPELLAEVNGYIRDPAHEQAVVMGTVTVAQMGLAGLVASRSPESIRQAEALAAEAGPHGEQDLRWVITALGGTWPA